MRGGEASVSVCVCVCWRCVRLMGVGVWCDVWAGGRTLLAIFTKMLQLSPKIEQCRAVALIVESIHYLLCIYLSLSRKKEKKICL